MASSSLSSYADCDTGAAFHVATQPQDTRTGFAGGSAQAQTNAYDLKVTESRSEREAAFKLVHDAYVRAGLMPHHPMGMRVMKHHLSDQTDVMVLKREGEIVFTSTLVRDGEYGLPLESLFAPEVKALRDQGLRVAEISCLASDIALQDKTHRFELFVELISLVFQTARHHQIDRVLLAVHPRHAKVHHRMFGCAPCSDVKEYAAVEGNPAVLCTHDFAHLDQARYCLYDKVYQVKHSLDQMVGARMTEAEKRYFGQAVTAHASSTVPMAA